MTRPSVIERRLDTLAEQNRALSQAVAALTETCRRLDEENRRLSGQVRFLLDDENEYLATLRENFEARIAKIESRVFQDVRERERRAREQILPWLEDHGRAIKVLWEQTEHFKRTLMEHSRGAAQRFEGLQHTIEDTRTRAEEGLRGLDERTQGAERDLHQIRQEVDDVKSRARRAVAGLRAILGVPPAEPLDEEPARDGGDSYPNGESQTKARDPDSLMTLDFGGKPLRIILRDGEPWFIAKEVCDALGIQNTAQAVGRLDEDERGLCSIDTLGGSQELLIVSESGFYLLTLRCRDTMKPGTTAYAFRRWVTREVLPTIHKTGRYEVILKEPPEVVPVAAPPALPAPPLPLPLPEDAHYTLQDPLHLLFVDFTDRRLRTEGRREHHTVSLGYGRLLAWLWRNVPEAGGIEIPSVNSFAATVGLSTRTLRRVLDRLVEWNLVERRHERRGSDGYRKTWPQTIHFDRAALHAALTEVGLAVPETLPSAAP
jgi:prophage antirepressor-like protein